MGAGSRSITVMDCRCGGFDLDGKDFKVKAAVNFIRYQMDEYITEDAVSGMIREGIKVTVQPVK